MKRFFPAVPVLLLSSSFGCHITLPSRSSLVVGGGVRLEHEAQRTETRALELSGEDALTLVTSFGSIEVRGSAGAPRLEATVRANGRTTEEAEQVLARYELVLERREDGPHAELVGEPLRIHAGSSHIELSAHVEFVAEIPFGTALTASSGSGAIVTRGPLGALELDTGFGSIRVDEARGDVRAKSGSGEVEVARIECGEAFLESGFGAVRVKAARARKLACESGSGDIRVDAADTAFLELETGFGAVHVGRAGGEVRAKSGSGDVRLHGVDGAVVARSGFGTVEIDGAFTALEATSGSGDVHVEASAGARVERSWKLSSDFGRVTLEVPAGFGCQLDAKTGFGSVECDFPVTLEAGKKKKNDNRLEGTVGGGGGTVMLHSGSGDVALKKL
jgi:DUF4097 and DUF4098 domain-containing protein YvlB